MSLKIKTGPFHDHQVFDRAPTVGIITVTRVVFLRGIGCCELSPVRQVTAYYEDDRLLAEVDPMPAAAPDRGTAS